MQNRWLIGVLFLALCGAVVFGLWRGFAGEPVVPQAPSRGGDNAPASALQGDVEEVAGGGGVDAATDEDRRVAAAGAATQAGPTATLRVHARWPGPAPAADVMIYLRRGERGLPYTAFARARTDAEGVAVFSGVVPGKLRLASDRGDRTTIDVAAGEQDVDFDLEGGVAVVGTVRDADGAGVAGAEIWLQTSSTGWSGGRVVAISAADGTFELEQIGPSLSIGALAGGFTRSTLVDLDVVEKDPPPARVDLQLGPPGGGLAGVVTDVDGAPVEGALVAAGANPRHLDYRGDRVIEQWTVRHAETDAEGRFSIPGLPTGAMPVAVRAAGFGLWRDEVRIETGGTTTIHPRLAASATVAGVVRETDGSPIANARVRVYDVAPRTPFLAGGQIDFDEIFGYRGAVSDAEGRYRIDGVTPGTAHAFAQRPRGRGRDGVSVAYVRTELAVPAGAEIEWDPVIDNGRSIEGVVLYRDGHPMPGLFITLADERSEMEHVIVSDSKGVFRFHCLDDTSYEVRVQLWDPPKGEPPLRQAGVVPDRGRIELRVGYDKPVKEEPGRVTGRIDDAGQRISNPLAARVVMHSDQRWFREDGKIENGAFSFDDVTPCRFRLSLMEGEQALAYSDWFELPAGGVVDAGVLRTEPAGAVRILLNRGDGADMLEPKLYLKEVGSPRSTVVAVGRRSECLVENLTPGDYEVTGYFRGMVPLRGTLTVTVGSVADATFALRRGASCTIEVWWPEGHSGSTRRGYRFVDADGATLHEFESALHTMPTRPYELRATLPPGVFRLEFWTDDDLRGELELTVPDSYEEVKQRMDLR